MYDKILKQARTAASKAKDTELKFKGVTYNLVFSRTHWHYTVTSDGEFVVNLNTKSATKAKAMLKEWLVS